MYPIETKTITAKVVSSEKSTMTGFYTVLDWDGEYVISYAKHVYDACNDKVGEVVRVKINISYAIAVERVLIRNKCNNSLRENSR